MVEIIPAVLAENFKELNNQLAKFVNIAKIIQIDICDGNFVPSISWPMDREDEENVEEILEEEEGLPFWKDLDYEFDLMVKDAHKKFDFFARLGASRIVFHLEAEEKESFKEFLEALDPYFKDNVEIGLSINIDTETEELAPFINYIDFIQCMGIKNIGYQGEPFDEKVLEKIKDIKKKYPEIKIGVDGGVNENTAPVLVEAGVEKLIMGSTFLRSYSIKETFEEFENL